MKNLILNLAFILYAVLLNDRIAGRMNAVMADPFMMPLIIFCFFAYLLSLRLGFLVEEFLAAHSQNIEDSFVRFRLVDLLPT